MRKKINVFVTMGFIISTLLLLFPNLSSAAVWTTSDGYRNSVWVRDMWITYEIDMTYTEYYNDLGGGKWYISSMESVSTIDSGNVLRYSDLTHVANIVYTEGSNKFSRIDIPACTKDQIYDPNKLFYCKSSYDGLFVSTNYSAKHTVDLLFPLYPATYSLSWEY
ncbi:hypothetical protein [Rossellomorea aquimaris]|uniref:Uncharacterized protein n=1 Tax=Rossellomorea aquimaris TaxID=189382 RepID=A0A1J6X4Y1_9BACI|nr:hypothetical protein [Rossellomorea aquimaris]OIU73185.1 hypothetical protein BHE18_15015 [Rossellomorea aquimaris]